MGDEVDVGHGQRQLRETARHVIARGDDDQLAIAVCVGPGPRFIRIADGVERLVAEIDAADEFLVAEAGYSLDVLFGGAPVDPGDEQALAAALFQEAGARSNPRFAARQYHDSVRVFGSIGLLAHDARRNRRSRRPARRRPGPADDEAAPILRMCRDSHPLLCAPRRPSLFGPV